MVINDGTPVWSDLGQTAAITGRPAGARNSYSQQELFGLGVPGHDRVERFASDGGDSLFGMGEESMFGQVLFPGIKRPDYAVNPLSGLGTVRIPDTESMGQVLFPGIKRPDYAVNPLSGLGTVRIPDMDSFGTVRIPDTDGLGTIRIPDDSSEYMGYMGQEAPATDLKAKIAAWNGAGIIATAALFAASMFTKGALKEGLRTASYVAGGVTAVALTKKFLG